MYKKIPRNEIKNYNDTYIPIVIVIIFNEIGDVLVQQRSLQKNVNPGYIDFVCGSIHAGETPEKAAIRETKEETGANLNFVQAVFKGINSYNRFRYLFYSEVPSDEKISVDSHKVEWVDFVSINTLKLNHKSEKWTFVDEFFEDLNSVLILID